MNAAVPPIVAFKLPPIIDVEASGFGRGSFPIEVGFVMADGRTYCTLIRPEPGWDHWDAAAETVHGVARPLLDSHGRAAHEVARQLNDLLRGQDVYSDGWVNDFSWLWCLFDSVDSAPAFRLKNLRELLSEEQAACWHDTKALVEGNMVGRRHRASADALLIQETLRQVKSSVR